MQLGYQDSNLEWLNQNQLCCQLHHTPLATCNRWSQAILRPDDQLSGNWPVMPGRRADYQRFRVDFSRAVCGGRRVVTAGSQTRQAALAAE